MRRVVCSLLVAGLAAAGVGCGTDSKPIPTGQSEAVSPDGVLVSLSVPNMT